MHTHTDTHKQTNAHSNTHSNKHTHTQTHVGLQYTHTQTHTHAHTQTHMHTHMQTFNQTIIFFCSFTTDNVFREVQSQFPKRRRHFKHRQWTIFYAMLSLHQSFPYCNDLLNDYFSIDGLLLKHEVVNCIMYQDI